MSHEPDRARPVRQDGSGCRGRSHRGVLDLLRPRHAACSVRGPARTCATSTRSCASPTRSSTGRPPRRASTRPPSARCSTSSRPRRSPRSTRGFSSNLVVHAFARTARECGIGEELIRPFFASMRTDLSTARHDAASHDDYVYGSAEVVGPDVPSGLRERRRAASDRRPTADLVDGARQPRRGIPGRQLPARPAPRRSRARPRLPRARVREARPARRCSTGSTRTSPPPPPSSRASRRTAAARSPRPTTSSPRSRCACGAIARRTSACACPTR